MPFLVGPIIFIAVVVIIFLVVLFFTGYVKASPDKAYIISGLRKTPKVLIGKAGIKIPFLEKKDELSLQLISIDVKTSNAVPTADYININVDATVNVKISDNPERLKLAAQNFLNKKTEYIAQVAREVLEGNVREIVGKMKLEEMVSDRQKFANLVKENAEPDLGEMGLDIISFNVQNFVDNNAVIENLGVDNIVKIQKNAAISRAESEKEIAKARAMAEQEANDARVASDTAIAERQNELAIKKAELKREADIKQAEADAAYEIQKEEQRKTIEVKSADANIAKQEKEILLKQKEADVEAQKLDAEIKKKAEADKFARQQKAEADLYERQKRAEAEKFEREKEAEAKKVQAEADLFAKAKEAEGIRMVGEAEAKAIEAKGIAEAEALEKKAEAMKKYGQAAMMEMIVNALPEMAKAIAEPLSTIDKVTIIDSGNGDTGVSSMGSYVPNVLAQTIEAVKETTGLDIVEVMKANTYDAKVNRNINITGLEDADAQTKSEVAAAVINSVAREDTTGAK
ncbi:MAG: flotillin family protein [Lachnospiraceae bacterium]|nr:flotillin family protein [Lachnospiraceae bacterium]